MPYANPATRREYLKQYCKRNAERARKRSAAWRRDNPERNAEMVERWATLRARPRVRVEKDPKLEKAKARDRAAKWRSQNRVRANASAAASKKRNRASATALQAKRKAQQKRAVPAWANLKLIREIYIRAAAESKTVDHIVPLQSSLVCGLHCETNLQLLSKLGNSQKYNLHWPDMP